MGDAHPTLPCAVGSGIAMMLGSARVERHLFPAAGRSIFHSGDDTIAARKMATTGEFVQE